MKNIKYILLFALIALALNACKEKEDVHLSSSEYFVSIAKNSALVVQDGGILKIPVVLGAVGPATTASYAFEDLPADKIPAGSTKAVLGTDFWVVNISDTSMITDYTLNFPKGTGTDTIYIVAPFTGDVTPKLINIVLKSNTSGYNLGMSTIEGSSCKLTVAYPSIDDFVGTYLAKTLIKEVTYAEFDVEITKGTGDTLLLNGLFAATIPKTEKIYDSLKDVPVKIAVDINTMTYTIPGQYLTSYSTSIGNEIYFGDLTNPAGVGPADISLSGDIDYGSRYFAMGPEYWAPCIFKDGKFSGYYTGVYGLYLDLEMKQ